MSTDSKPTTAALWFTAAELRGLPGLPSTEFRTREALKRLGIPSRQRAGRHGGGGLEYEVAALPWETRCAAVLLHAAHLGDTVLAQEHEQAAPVAAQPQPHAPDASSGLPHAPDASSGLPHAPDASAGLPAPAAIRPLSLPEQACADARAALVQRLQHLAEDHGLKRACLILSGHIAAPGAEPSLVALAQAANQRRRGAAMVSARTLERWHTLHREGGWHALLPVRSEPPAPVPDRMEQDVAAVLSAYHSRDPRFRKLSGAAKEVTRLLGRDFDTWTALYARARRALDRLGTSHAAHVALIKARHTASERDARLPFKRRDASMLAPLDVVVMDGHTFKAKVRHPDHGAPFAPELTLALDWATRRIVGWSVSLSENVFAVGDALRHVVSQHGVPAILYTDNGSGETARAMDCPIDGYCARIGVEHRTGIPGKPQGRGVIERSWQTHAINLARRFDSYQGSDVDAGTFRKVASELAKEQRAVRRAQADGTVVRLSARCPTWAEFIEAVSGMVQQYNATHRHRGLPRRADGKHMTPDEAWEFKLDPTLIIRPTEGELRELFMPAVLRTAQRGEVRFFNQVYAAPELMRADVDGREVSVRYDVHDPSFVRIYTLDGAFVCDASWNANRIDAFPKPVVQMAREKRVKTTIKRREQQIDTALRELGGTAASIHALPAPQAPVVLPMVVDAPSSDASQVQPTAEAPHQQQRPAFFETQSERYEWLMKNRDLWSSEDAAWAAAYAASDDYAVLSDYYAARGLAWTEGGGAFKQAL